MTCGNCIDGKVSCDPCKGSGNHNNNPNTSFPCGQCSGQGHYDCPDCN